MSREFKVKRKYYDNECRQLYKHNSFTINPGITVLIGCNGSGKTTLQSAIYDDLRSNNIPAMQYDNLSKGGSNSLSELMWKADYEAVAQMWCDSEGEAITDNLLRYAKKFAFFLQHGYEELSDFAKIFRDEPEDSKSNERWILFDAIDSGLSIDQVRDVKQYFFSKIIEFAKDNELYIIVTANEYEMCRNSNCFSVFEGKYINLNSYDDYADAILKSRDYKEKMLKKYAESLAKKRSEDE